MCTVHMDYLQHGYSRRCKIVCEEGTIVWDLQWTIGKNYSTDKNGHGKR